MRHPAHAFLLLLPLLLTACDQLGIETPAVERARREAEGKAIGGACRHVSRSVEACYLNNKKADKAAIFAGWREMNDYMRENKIESMAPPPEPVKPAAAPPDGADEAVAAKDGKDTKVAAQSAKGPPKAAKGH